MTRLDRQSDNSMVEAITDLRASVDTMRTAQKFGASDVRVFKLTNTSSNFDITVSGPIAANSVFLFEWTITPNSTAVSNPTVVYDWAFQVSSTYSGSFSYNYTFLPLPPVAGVQKIRTYVSSSTSLPDISIGGTFWTVSPATYSVARITPVT